MKKLVLIAGLMLAYISGYAQMQPGIFSITPKVGVNIASMTNSGDANSRIAFAAGLDLEYQINRQFSFGIGADYSQQGVNDDPLTLKTDYLNIPFTVSYYPVRGLGLYVGIQPGVLLRKKAEVTYSMYSRTVAMASTEVGDMINDFRNEYDMKYDGVFAAEPGENTMHLSAKSGVLALPIGVSYETDKCKFGIKYSIGLGNAIVGSGVSCTHNVLQISLGYKINVFGDDRKSVEKK